MEQRIYSAVAGNRQPKCVSMDQEGICQKGAALNLNRETSKWIANRRAQVEGVYVRSGHNFSPDWMTRADYDQILSWAERYGFSRVRLRPLRDEMMADYRKVGAKEVCLPEIRTECQAGRPLKCVGWNGGGTSFVTAAHRFGLNVQFLRARHGRVINQFCKWYNFESYDDSNDIFIMGGSARSEDEVVQFRQAVKLYSPKYAILITPLRG